MRRSFLLFVLSVFCCLRFPAAAQGQEHVITEAELTQLENISENLRISRQNLQSQANALTERLRAQERKAKTLTEKLQKAESIAKDLSSQLQTERATLKALRQSYNAYEQEVTQRIAAQQAIIDKQKNKINRLTVTIIMLLTALAGIVVIAIAKLKRFFPFLP